MSFLPDFGDMDLEKRVAINRKIASAGADSFYFGFQDKSSDQYMIQQATPYSFPTPDDNDIIDQITQMGFDKNKAIEVLKKYNYRITIEQLINILSKDC